MFRMKPNDTTKDPKAAKPPVPPQDTAPPEPPADDAAPQGDPNAVDATSAVPLPDAGAPPLAAPMGGLAAGVSPAPLLGKLSQLTSGYLGPENGPFMCGNCRHFDGQGGCEVVDGDIDPQGCCSVFEGGEQMAGGGMEQVPSPQPMMDAGMPDAQLGQAPPEPPLQG